MWGPTQRKSLLRRRRRHSLEFSRWPMRLRCALQGIRRVGTTRSLSALDSISGNTAIPSGVVEGAVHKGGVTLSGEVAWQFQKTTAEEAVRSLCGVSAVTNTITLKSQLQPADVRDRIQKALERSVGLDGNA